MGFRMGENREVLRASALEDLSRDLEEELGFTAIVVNMYRPSEDDYEAIVMRGPDDLRETLHGAVLSRESWMALFDPKYERYGTFFVPEGQGDWGDAPFYEPADDSGEGENRWRKGDALFAPIRCPRGTILGILSVDAPASGRRPSDRDILKISALCSKAAAALEPT